MGSVGGENIPEMADHVFGRTAEFSPRGVVGDKVDFGMMGNCQFRQFFRI